MQNNQEQKSNNTSFVVSQQMVDVTGTRLNGTHSLALTQAEEDSLKNQTNFYLAGHYLHRSGFAVYVASPLVFFIIYCFYGLVPNINLFGWAAAMLASDMFILRSSRGYNPKNTTLDATKKNRLKIIRMQAVSSFCWGCSTFLLASFNHTLASANYLLFASCGVVAAFASNVMATSSRALYSFIGVLGVLVLTYFAIHFDEYFLWLLGTSLLLIACLFIGHSNNQQIREYLRMTALNELMADKLAQSNVQLHDLATRDALTGVRNRRWIDEQMILHISAARRYQQPLSLMLVDVDYFKRINDTHGHEVGDEVLIDTAQLLTKWQRDTDLMGRYGGEEFVVLLPMTNLEDASHLAERLRTSISKYSIYKSKYGKDLTVSIGVAQLSVEPAARDYESADKLLRQLINHADEALYAAKGNGRNRVELYQPE